MVRSSSSSSNNTRLYVIIGILAFAIIVGTVIGSSYASRELFANSKRLVYLYMDKCPFCTDFNAEWTQIESAVKANPSRYDFTTQTYNLTSDEGKRYANENKIEYAPAILFVGLKTSEFDGNTRRAAEILTWVQGQNNLFPSVQKQT